MNMSEITANEDAQNQADDAFHDTTTNNDTSHAAADAADVKGPAPANGDGLGPFFYCCYNYHAVTAALR